MNPVAIKNFWDKTVYCGNNWWRIFIIINFIFPFYWQTSHRFLLFAYVQHGSTIDNKNIRETEFCPQGKQTFIIFRLEKPAPKKLKWCWNLSYGYFDVCFLYFFLQFSPQ